MNRDHPMLKAFEVLRNANRVVNLDGAPLTIELLDKYAYELVRNRRSSHPDLADGPVDLFFTPGTSDAERIGKRAWAWAKSRAGAPVRSEGLIQVDILHTERVSLAFVRDPFEFCIENTVSMIFIPDLVWNHNHFVVMSPKNHLILEDWT